jgi:UDP-N-acetylglucosamine 2-epimerase (non-hydrolysing)
MKVLSVVGARPNFVKIAPLLAEMRKHQGIQPLLVHTGQHYNPEMSDTFFRDLHIPRPDINLGVGPSNPIAQTAEIMKRLDAVMTKERPDVVVVVGDVNSTLAGALAAVKLGIPVAHVEAGLRSFDRSMPEEINRIITDAVSDLLFVSEPSGVENLLNEGRPRDRIFLVGNVMIDTLISCLPSARRMNTIRELGLIDGRNDDKPKKYAVLTLHRPATVDDPNVLRKIWVLLQDIAREIPIIFPVHPRTQKRLRELGLKALNGRGPTRGRNGILTISSLGYLRFLHLESEATLVITDSGGIQEETTALGIPCLTMRNNTERPVTVIEGTNTIVGLDPARIREGVYNILSGNCKRGRVPHLWDGHCAERIVKVLCDHFDRRLKWHLSQTPGAKSTCVSPIVAS